MLATQPIERTFYVRTPLHGQCRKGHLASVNALSSEGNLLDNVGSAEHGCPFLIRSASTYGKESQVAYQRIADLDRGVMGGNRTCEDSSKEICMAKPMWRCLCRNSGKTHAVDRLCGWMYRAALYVYKSTRLME